MNTNTLQYWNEDTILALQASPAAYHQKVWEDIQELIPRFEQMIVTNLSSGETGPLAKMLADMAKEQHLTQKVTIDGINFQIQGDAEKKIVAEILNKLREKLGTMFQFRMYTYKEFSFTATAIVYARTYRPAFSYSRWP